MSSARPIDRVLSVVEVVKGPDHRGEYLAFCLVHNDQNTPNLHIGEAEDGRALLRCFAGCSQERLLAALEERGVGKANLFSNRNVRGGGGVPTPENSENHENGENLHAYRNNSENDSDCTVAAYAEYVQLPEDYLREKFALRDFKHMGSPSVLIPYPDEIGTEQSTRYRLKLHKGDGADTRFKWRKGDKTRPYGLWDLSEAREKGYVVLVEGESDTQTLSYHGEPSIGIPGANNWKDEWADYFEGIPKVYVVKEPDQGGTALWNRLARSPLKEQLYKVTPPEGVEDVAALHKVNPEGFSEAWRGCLEEAVAWMDMAQNEEAEQAAAAWERCKDLATLPNILDEFEVTLRRCFGVVGERVLVRLLFLAMVTRLFKKIVSVVVTGPSAVGKSHSITQVLKFFLEENVFKFTAMSEKVLAYKKESFSHRMMVMFEAAGLEHNDFAAYLMRTLLSEGEIIYEYVNADGPETEVVQVHKEGPTGLITSTTSTSLYHENETRMVMIPADDSSDQTKNVLEAQADEEDEDEEDDEPDLSAWHDLQRWLESGEREVWVPYSKALSRMIDPVAIRLRRDFPALLSLIRADALLHRESRPRDKKGRIVATLADYLEVKGLFDPLLSAMNEVAVPEGVREVVEAVQALTEDEEDGVSGTKIIAFLNRQDTVSGGQAPSKATVYRNIDYALKRNYLRDLNGGRGPKQLRPDAPLPKEGASLLPEAKELSQAWGEHRFNDPSFLDKYGNSHHSHDPRGIRGGVPPPPTSSDKREKERQQQRQQDTVDLQSEGLCADAAADASSDTDASDASLQEFKREGNGFIDGDERLRAFLEDPPEWFRRQAAACVQQGMPERLLKPLASTVAYQCLDDAHQWREVLPFVEGKVKGQPG